MWWGVLRVSGAICVGPLIAAHGGQFALILGWGIVVCTVLYEGTTWQRGTPRWTAVAATTLVFGTLVPGSTAVPIAYLKAVGETTSGVVVDRYCHRIRGQSSDCWIRLAGPDGNRLGGRMEETAKRHAVGDRIVVTHDPLGIVGPKPADDVRYELPMFLLFPGIALFVGFTILFRKRRNPLTEVRGFRE
ncbi:hypothetical protein H0264_15735 [Nocardia huaxiensis]|uniref:DUF3592 domain-containing protein n=1 Tax=Nocardia huaxiensis TaxID=2755382 RepID=A0A7D6VCX5_9NOCA|nr:hypothetical protein [Nocardia huaxiensis]QLY33481.1 hypothetical protein H0264_15735 [Nocardia huaxiensis]